MNEWDERFERVLVKICENENTEAIWLDLLSQLEFAGCRKIVKGVPFERVDVEVLNHVMEEASHAFLLKTLVEKSHLPAKQAWEKNPLSELGWTYFQTLDQGVSKMQKGTLPYPAVSWIVEQRVLDIYPRYLQHTRNLGVKRVVQRILAQEKRHSALFGDERFSEDFKRRAIDWEAGLWADFVSGLERWLTPAMAEWERSRTNTARVL